MNIALAFTLYVVNSNFKVIKDKGFNAQYTEERGKEKSPHATPTYGAPPETGN
jgi:hypothetical protein